MAMKFQIDVFWVVMLCSEVPVMVTFVSFFFKSVTLWADTRFVLYTVAEENRLQMHSVSILSISQGLVWNLSGGQGSRFCVIMFILKFENSITNCKAWLKCYIVQVQVFPL
jgi:hypothetical protein